MDQRSKDLLDRLHAIAVVQARRYAEILHELERLLDEEHQEDDIAIADRWRLNLTRQPMAADEHDHTSS